MPVNMNIGFSLFLIAVGAILTWGITATVAGMDILVIGVILMVVGAIGVALSLLFWSGRRTAVVETHEVVDRL
jgi:hypothetical protein